MSQEELDNKLKQHRLWLETRGAEGERADLRGAKFDINIRDCWGFAHAKFTPDALPWLILHPEWTEFKGTVQIHPS